MTPLVPPDAPPPDLQRIHSREVAHAIVASELRHHPLHEVLAIQATGAALRAFVAMCTMMHRSFVLRLLLLHPQDFSLFGGRRSYHVQRQDETLRELDDRVLHGELRYEVGYYRGHLRESLLVLPHAYLKSAYRVFATPDGIDFEGRNQPTFIVRGDEYFRTVDDERRAFVRDWQMAEKEPRTRARSR